jgi:predicted small lipoprotein YifL
VTRIPVFALVGLAVAALSLAGCGRKTGLDAPPGAAAVQNEASQPVQSSADRAAGNLLDPPGTGRAPVAARGDNKRILLDGLID